jgi:hypothetical protein
LHSKRPVGRVAELGSLGVLPSTPEEFFATVDTEFGFLVSEHGYQRATSDDLPFTAEYQRGSLCIRVSGISYGFGAHLEVFVDGQFLPLWPVMTKLTERKATPTDSRNSTNCASMVGACAMSAPPSLRATSRRWKGFARLSVSSSGRLRQRDRLMSAVVSSALRTSQFAECVTHLQQSPFELSETWRARFDYARRHA